MGNTERSSVGKDAAQFLLLIASGVLIVIVFRTVTHDIPGPDISPPPLPESEHISVKGGAVERLKKAIRIQTISWEVGRQNDSELQKFVDFVTEAFPLVHSSPIIKRELVGNYSLLYTVKGTDPSLQPYMLNGHLDVVPVAADRWDYPPFGAVEEDGFIYGRGTIDDKHQVMGLLETLEYMLKNKKFKPKRSFYIGIGHDEEILGYNGAQQIAKILKSRGVKLAFIHDEGMAILDGVIPGAQKPIGYIGTSEKGWLVIKLSVSMRGGHSSMPPAQTSIRVLANAVSRLKTKPQPNQFGKGDEAALFEHIAHVLGYPHKILMSNLWLFNPLVARLMTRQPFTNALTRTTTAVTMFNAGIKFNVISPYAEAIVNHRIHPGQTAQEVLEHDIKAINDPRVNVTVVSSVEASPSSPYDENSLGFHVVKASIKQAWHEKDILVSPGLLVGGTDTRWYQDLTDSIYRISPSYLGSDDPPRFHGVNERISIENYEKVLKFYFHLIHNADNMKVPVTERHGGEL